MNMETKKIENGISAEKYEILRENVNGLKGEMTKTNVAIKNIKEGSMNLTEQLTKIQEMSKLVDDQVRVTTEVVSMIQRNANYSNILALNASIESARAGQAGKGFAVVAEEMGKFSKQSEESAKQIKAALTQMVEALEEVIGAVDKSTGIAKEQTQAVEEIAEAFVSVTTHAEDLLKNNTI